MFLPWSLRLGLFAQGAAPGIDSPSDCAGAILSTYTCAGLYLKGLNPPTLNHAWRGGRPAYAAVCACRTCACSPDVAAAVGRWEQRGGGAATHLVGWRVVKMDIDGSGSRDAHAVCLNP